MEIPAGSTPTNRDMLFNFYGSWQTHDEFVAKYRDLMDGIASLEFIAGFCYTQLTDIEQQTSELLTYERKPKIDLEVIAEIHDEVLGTNQTADK